MQMITNDIIRNGQKFSAADLKNFDAENLWGSPLRLLNNPPVKKVFIRNPRTKRKKNPAANDEERLFIPAPRSTRVSRSIPSESRSVIILLPKPEFNDPFKGNASEETRSSEKNHIIRTPFQDFTVRTIPFGNELKIHIWQL